MDAVPCKFCTCATDKDGYGKVFYSPTGKKERAHRIAYVEHHGLSMAAIAGVVIRHTCDNRPCIEPAHLIAGTQLDNVRDRQERARQARGEKVNSCKLNPLRVLEIRQKLGSGQSVNSLAREFGVDPRAIRAIKNGQTWKHVTPHSNGGF